uniref:Uncharacterized protein n=1 Tax=Arundo donax TaxID=35708 RepID=A0A0A9B5X6_ARUDO
MTDSKGIEMVFEKFAEILTADQL